MRLRAHITIDIDAADYLEAAEHQRKIETCLSSVKTDYPEAEVTVRERRGARPPKPHVREVRVHSGRLRVYE